MHTRRLPSQGHERPTFRGTLRTAQNLPAIGSWQCRTSGSLTQAGHVMSSALARAVSSPLRHPSCNANPANCSKVDHHRGWFGCTYLLRSVTSCTQASLTPRVCNSRPKLGPQTYRAAGTHPYSGFPPSNEQQPFATHHAYPHTNSVRTHTPTVSMITHRRRV